MLGIAVPPPVPVITADTLLIVMGGDDGWGSGVAGNNGVSWDPTISIAVPAGVSDGTYSGVITHSVS
jgi:hypothetical protein